MSELSKQELSGLDTVIAGRKPLSHDLNNQTNMQANYVMNSNSGILQHEDIALTGGGGLSIDELTTVRARSLG